MQSMSSTLASPTPNTVKELSGELGEPAEVSQQRVDALDLFNKLPLEKSPLYSKYVDMVSGLNLDAIQIGHPGREKSLPKEISHLIKTEEPTLALQVDSQMVRTEVHGTLEKEGIIFTDIQTAIRKYPDLVRAHLAKAIPADEDKFAALNNSFFTAGTFLYVPKGIQIKIPFRNIILVKNRGHGAFARNLIVAEENTKVTFLQEAYSHLNGATSGPGLYSETTEAYLGEGSEINFASLQNFEDDVHCLVNRRAMVGRDARINWTVGHIGGGITRSRMDSVLNGQGASAEDVEVVFGGEAQRFDVVTDLTHEAPHTTGHVLARGVLKDTARSIFKGMIRIEQGAKNSNSYLAEHAMILSKKARADAIPGLEIETNEVKATHSGSVSQIDEEQVFYMMARGLTMSEAQRLIILGFLHPAVQRIPLRTVRASIQYLIEEKWVGRRGLIPPRADSLPEFVEEPEAEAISGDLFERHYKYR